MVALLALFVLSTIAAGTYFVTHTQIWASYNYRLSAQARYTAEAGAQKTMNWLINNYTPPTDLTPYDMTKTPVQYSGKDAVLSAIGSVSANYPDSAVQSAFNSALNNQSVSGMGVNANYSVAAELLRMRQITLFGGGTAVLQTWEITSQGTISGLRDTQVQVVEAFEKVGIPVFKYAAFATGNTCASLKFDSGGTTDSYDSSAGLYPAGQQNSNGNLGTNGNLLNSSTLTVNGSLSTPYGSTTGPCPSAVDTSSGNPITATGGLQTLTPPTYPTPTIPVTPTTAYPMPSSIPPGTYGNATGSGTIHFSAGTYNFNSINCSSAVTFVVDSGPVILNLGGVGISGYVLNFQSGVIINAGGKPSDFQIIYGGTAGLNFQSGANPINAVIYAPNSNVNFQSDGGFYGSMITKTTDFQSNVSLHYDRSLMTSLQIAGSYHPVTFSWSKY